MKKLESSKRGERRRGSRKPNYDNLIMTVSVDNHWLGLTYIYIADASFLLIVTCYLTFYLQTRSRFRARFTAGGYVCEDTPPPPLLHPLPIKYPQEQVPFKLDYG